MIPARDAWHGRRRLLPLAARQVVRRAVAWLVGVDVSRIVWECLDACRLYDASWRIYTYVYAQIAVAWLVGVDVSGTGTLELSENVWIFVVFTMRAGASTHVRTYIYIYIYIHSQIYMYDASWRIYTYEYIYIIYIYILSLEQAH